MRRRPAFLSLSCFSGRRASALPVVTAALPSFASSWTVPSGTQGLVALVDEADRNGLGLKREKKDTTLRDRLCRSLVPSRPFDSFKLFGTSCSTKVEAESLRTCRFEKGEVEKLEVGRAEARSEASCARQIPSRPGSAFCPCCVEPGKALGAVLRGWGDDEPRVTVGSSTSPSSDVSSEPLSGIPVLIAQVSNRPVYGKCSPNVQVGNCCASATTRGGGGGLTRRVSKAGVPVHEYSDLEQSPSSADSCKITVGVLRIA